MCVGEGATSPKHQRQSCSNNYFVPGTSENVGKLIS